MCLMAFKSFEVQKSLPFKMLLYYKYRTERSGRKALDLSHLRVLSMDFLSYSVRVCNLCYSLLIGEYELG